MFIRILVDGKADINVVGADGAQPIHIAAKYFKAFKHSDHVDTTTSNIVTQDIPCIDNVLTHLITENDNAEVSSRVRPQSAEVQDVINYFINAWSRHQFHRSL